jgi:uncharacterized protein with NAD-binding domain and iron-sulfur cluster
MRRRTTTCRGSPHTQRCVRTAAHDGDNLKTDDGQNGKPRVVKVAIVGGGCAGIAAAWELSRPDPSREETYDITIYERSWRLGGKGASGRDEHGRIREHGIHIWLGFYENAFRMMRECYERVERKEWGPARDDNDSVLPYGTFDHAFFPEPHIGVASRDGSETWKVWSGFLPPMDGLPGTPLDEETNPFTLQAYLVRCLEMTKALIHSVLGPAGEKATAGSSHVDGRSTLDEALDLDFSFDLTQSPAVLVERMVALVRAGMLTTAAGVLQGVTIVESLIRERNPAPQFSEGVLKFIETLATQTRKQLRDFVNIDPETRRKTQVIDLIMTIVVGLLRDRVLTSPRGLDAINHIDCKEWLIKHGAVKESVESPFVTGLYDLAFCYRDGDRTQPALAAGQALRGALRMFFSYRGAIFWRMRGGMGETVFSPLFRVLKERGVKFKFLHDLKRVTFAGDSPETRVSTLVFDSTESVDGFSDDYPLDHFGCWRHARPKTRRAEDSEELTKRVVLNDGEDFHAVVLAMAIDDFLTACGKELTKLPKQGQRWEKMRQSVKTIATQGAQVWMTSDLAELGWRRGSVLVSALEGPFQTWADMTHTLAAEHAWRAHKNCPAQSKGDHPDVKSIAYFLGVLPQTVIKKIKHEAGGDAVQTKARLEKQIRVDLGSLLKTGMKSFWPAAYSAPYSHPTLSPLKLLATPLGNKGGTLTGQHIQASFIGSDRYTLAVPGSLEHRISPLHYLVVNMTIAGDWTECGFNEGCIEAAVMSGMLAAHAISRKPDLNDIIGYHHP